MYVSSTLKWFMNKIIKNMYVDGFVNRNDYDCFLYAMLLPNVSLYCIKL